MPSRILFVFTSVDKTLTGAETGWYLPEAAHPYYVLKGYAYICVLSIKSYQTFIAHIRLILLRPRDPTPLSMGILSKCSPTMKASSSCKTQKSSKSWRPQRNFPMWIPRSMTLFSTLEGECLNVLVELGLTTIIVTAP